MLSILRREDYTPNYKAVGWWLKNGKKEGTVSDKKMKQYAIEVKPLCKNSGELNSYGYLLLGINKTAEALNIFRLNTLLFPGDANVYDSLGEAYLKAGDTAMAIDNYQKVLELQPDNANAKTMLEKIKAQ
jgi:tetratricopeptide (TPR) repeat protein